ncbi:MULTISPECIES: alpha-L-rhamnosidase C-terminal domain-containing protein [unclassified Streptomyces]|uniref:alpha-L-rhamnosidase C-terminal domain-containing protein n=1 Tax=unclassified Streptomyces TaxID=2593676 RepID=UPI0035DEF3EF
MTGHADHTAPSSGDPLAGWEHDTDWHVLVPEAPARARPTGIRALCGDVRLPRGEPSEEDALELRSTGAHAPARVLVDYGQELSGHPWHTTGPCSGTTTAAAGTPLLRAGYSESLRHAAPDGDLVFDGLRVAGNPRRYEEWSVEPGRTTRQRFVQGGFRYQVLTLRGPGSVRLTGLGVHRTDCPAPAADYAGHFLCDDPLLNRIWYAGAHTVQLNLLPAGSDAGYWVFDEHGLDARHTFTDPDGLDHGLLRDGGWSDVRLDVRVHRAHGTAGCVLRAGEDGSGLLFRLTPEGPVVEHRARIDAEPVVLASAPTAAVPGGDDGWQLLTATVHGEHAELRLAGHRILSARVPAPAGTDGRVGLGVSADGAARFRRLTVRPAGAAPIHLELDSAADAERFRRPGVTERPTLLDGIKRDRLVWQGDNMVAARVLMLIDERWEYARASLRQLADRQLPSGYVPANTNPAAPPRPTGQRYAEDTVRYPSAAYSLAFVLNLHDYWMHTGDLGFVAELRETMDRQLAWNASRRGPDGLLRTGIDDGMSWRYSLVEGTPAYENALYAAALGHAARMYRALGTRSDLRAAAECARQAARVTRAVVAAFRDPATGLIGMSGEQPGVTPLDAATAVVLHGLLDAPEARRTLEATSAVLDTPRGMLAVPLPATEGQFPILGPMMAGMFTWALAENGMTEQALDLVRRMWGPMADGDPGRTVWEVMDADGSLTTPGINSGHGGNTSLAHPWSVGPTALLSCYVLGVLPREPGYLRWQLAPCPARLGRARGELHTPYGRFRVRWVCPPGGGMNVEVCAPADTRGEFVVPRAYAGLPVRVDGAPVGNPARISLDGGRAHRVDVG